MKTRKKLNYIIFLMSIALIGLVGLQIYWVNISLQVKKERFNQDVHEALANLVKKLEKRETAFVVESKFLKGVRRNSAGLNYYFRSKSSHPKVNYFHEPNCPLDSNLPDSCRFTYSEKIKSSDISTIDIQRRGDGGSTLYISTREANPGKKSTLQNFKISKDSGRIIRIKSKMVSLVMDELIDRPKNLRERITRDLLDSLLNIELIAKGIDIPYEFDVVGFQGNKSHYYVFQNEPALSLHPQKSALLKAKYATMLFPNDLHPQNNKLLINFPEEQSFMLKKMWAVLASAFVFIALIIFCFTFAVNTILKQKKMSDMTKDFINNMTHEFKTPIATVSLACQAMQDPDVQQLPNQMNRYLHMVKEENDRLGQQVEKVLQIARLDREDFKLNITEVDVHQSITKAIRNIHIQVEKRGGILNTELQAEQTHIHADEMHLTNMIINLLDNANKYSPSTPEITIQTQNNDRGIKVMISDKGQGISKEMINKVFDKFYRVPTGNVHDVKGFGLGLSYVKTMVDAHQGEIQVKSEPTKGSTFTLFFPYMSQSA